MKKYFYPILIALFILSGLIMSTPTVFAEAPEPQCVCAECGYTCGSGHASDCSSKPK